MHIRSFVIAAMLLVPGKIAFADVADVAQDVLRPAYAHFAESAAALAAAAEEDCSVAALVEPYQQAWDAWAAIDYFKLGPVEQDGRALQISFWPDKKSSGQRAQQGMADANAAVIDDPAQFATISVAARGLSGLERLLYQPMIQADEDVLCRMRRTTAADLARTASEIDANWPGFETVLTTAGSADNTRYLSAAEAQQAIYTQLVTGLDYVAETRLGRPIGTAEKPRPEAAEARAAGRSLRNVTISLTGLRDLAMALHPSADKARDSLDSAIRLSQELDDPVFDGLGNPEGHARIMDLKRAVLTAKRTVESDIGSELGLTVGFNSQDGD